MGRDAVVDRARGEPGQHSDSGPSGSTHERVRCWSGRPAGPADPENDPGAPAGGGCGGDCAAGCPGRCFDGWLGPGGDDLCEVMRRDLRSLSQTAIRPAAKISHGASTIRSLPVITPP
jgi:hypothetical protein